MLSGGSPVSVVRPHLTCLKLPAAFLGKFQNVVWDMSVNPKNIEELPEDATLLNSLSLGAKTFKRDQFPPFKSLGTVLREKERGFASKISWGRRTAEVHVPSSCRVANIGHALRKNVANASI